jgi:chromosome segregation ATPase
LEELINLQKRNEEQAGNIFDLKTKISQMNDRNAELTLLVRSYQEKVSDREATLEEIQKERVDLERRLVTAMKANQEVDKQKLQTEVDSQKFKINSLMSVNEMYKRNIDELKTIISNKIEEVTQLQSNLKVIQEQYDTKDKENLENEKERIKFTNLSKLLQEKLDKAEAELDKKTKEADELFVKNSELTHLLTSQKDSNSYLHKDREEALDNIEKLSLARRDLEHKIQNAQKQYRTS